MQTITTLRTVKHHYHLAIRLIPLALAISALAQAPNKDALVNGGFDESPVGQPPAGWTAAYPNAGGVVATDGKATFLRLTSAQGANAGATQEVTVPPKATTVLVIGKMRGRPHNVKEDKNAAVQVCVRYIDAGGVNIGAAGLLGSDNSPNWHTFRREFKLPPGCTKLKIDARSVFAIGTFEFDEVRVEFK
jgi:hypothetical protein